MTVASLNVSPPERPWLIVNADDFGQGIGINEGVVEAHQRGIVTSASLMVRWPAAASAAAYARDHPDLSVGLHVDLGEWERRVDGWEPLYTVAAIEDAGAVSLEVDEQLSRFRELMGRDPTHLDSHQHVHRAEPVASILAVGAARLKIPLRERDARVRYQGGFFGHSARGESMPDAITVEALLAILSDLRPGSTELGCHPGKGEDVNSPYRLERNLELATLCDDRVRTAIIDLGIGLSSFADLLARVPTEATTP